MGQRKTNRPRIVWKVQKYTHGYEIPFDNGDNKTELFDKWCQEVCYNKKKSKTELYFKK